MKGWNKYYLEQLSEFITKGSTPTTFGFQWVESGIPFLRSECVTDEGFNKKGLSYISDEAHNYMERSKVLSGDILISITGNVGRIALFPEELKEGNINQHIARVRVNNFEVCDKYFIFYQLVQDSYRQYCNGIVTGAAYPQLSLKQIRETPVFLPSLPTQRIITSILSAYDDLIENNLKRIKLLEEIAQRTYEVWFVKFRINGKLLKLHKVTGLPEGWEKIQVKDYVSEISKGPSLNYDFDGKKYPVINQSCIRNGEIELEKVLFAQELNDNKEKCYLKINDILINSMGQGTLGRVSKNVSINEKFIIHNCITFLRAKETLSQYQLFYFISSQQSYFEGVAQGSTGQTTLKVSLIEELEISLPNKNIIKEFNKIVDPIWKQMGILKNQNKHLKESRDILLPRLMSGVIEVG